jgi:hypothetical protein
MLESHNDVQAHPISPMSLTATGIVPQNANGN